MNNFKENDEIICINQPPTPDSITIGKKYKVIDDGYLVFYDDNGERRHVNSPWFENCFELAKQFNVGDKVKISAKKRKYPSIRAKGMDGEIDEIIRISNNTITGEYFVILKTEKNKFGFEGGVWLDELELVEPIDITESRPLTCHHKWKEYFGLKESFTYCELCDVKK